jgi:DNA (cytosine-5)-methyltransferase 1
MYGLDLFSGIGGLSKALECYVWPVAYCDIEPYSRSVLLSRMATGDIPIAPIWDDVTTLHGNMLPAIDIIYGGFPCQDISCAGRQAGLGGKRSGLFFEIVRLAGETKAEWLFLENVPNIRTKGLGRVLKELDKLGYDCRWGLLSAADVGANHKRERWFLLAHANCIGRAQVEQPVVSRAQGEKAVHSFEHGGESAGRGWWEVEPNVGRVVDELPKRVDRLRALGNAVVPAQAREAFERLLGLKGE